MSAPRRRADGIETLAMRELYRDEYARRRDPIAEDRLLWRAQTFRHLVHLMPGETLLELGCGRMSFTRQLVRVSRGENPIVAVTFQAAEEEEALDPVAGPVERLRLDELPGALEGRRFDYVVGIDLLDRRTTAWALSHVHELLEPGGQVLFYESNPWNPVLRLWRLIHRMVARSDPRTLVSRHQFYELLSEVGFIRVFAVYNDFVYAPLTRTLIWFLRNLSIVLENTPGIRSLAGSILVHAQKPPRGVKTRTSSLCVHEGLHGAVSIVVPCHNEEMNVGPLIERLLRLYDRYIHEIILVDDNSSDATAAVIREHAADEPRVRLVQRTPPNGVGLAIADGLRAASGRWVLSMDCDFQHLLPEIRDLFDAAAAGHAVVFGSRFSRLSVLLNYPFLKILSNRTFHVLAQLALLRRFRDVTNNLKLMRRDVVENLVLTQAGFAVNAEIGLQAVLLGHTVKEVPISWIDRMFDMGTSSFGVVRSGGGYLKVLWHALTARLFRAGPYAPLVARTRRKTPLATEPADR